MEERTKSLTMLRISNAVHDRFDIRTTSMREKAIEPEAVAKMANESLNDGLDVADWMMKRTAESTSSIWLSRANF